MEDAVKRMAETFGLDENLEPPALHPELVDSLYDYGGDFGETLKHPLVIAVPYIEQMNHHYNKQLEGKLTAVEKAGANNEWGSFVFLHERPYRLHAFMQIPEDRITDAEYWNLLADIWTDSENIYQNLAEWHDVLTVEREQRELMMDEDERTALDKLPYSIAVYRGENSVQGDVGGLSWTTDKQRAEWFAKRFGHKGAARVVSGAIEKKNVIAHFLGRGEAEIVVLSEDVDISYVYEV